MKLTVNQFAELVGVSTQAIYKQIHNKSSKLQPYITYDGRAALIDDKAASELYHINQPADNQTNPNNQPIQPADNQTNQPNQPKQPTYTTDMSALLETISVLRDQLAQKDKEINDLLLLLKQQQTLTAQSNYLLLENGSAPEPEQSETETEPEPMQDGSELDQTEPEPEQSETEQTINKNWWQRFVDWLNE